MSRDSLAARVRDQKRLAASTLVYGEINFEPFGLTFEKIKKKYGGLVRLYHPPCGPLASLSPPSSRNLPFRWFVPALRR